MPVLPRMTQSRVPYYMTWGFQLVSVVFCVVAFGTGNWYEAEPSFSQRKFMFVLQRAHGGSGGRCVLIPNSNAHTLWYVCTTAHT